LSKNGTNRSRTLYKENSEPVKGRSDQRENQFRGSSREVSLYSPAHCVVKRRVICLENFFHDLDSSSSNPAFAQNDEAVFQYNGLSQRIHAGMMTSLDFLLPVRQRCSSPTFGSDSIRLRGASTQG